MSNKKLVKLAAEQGYCCLWALFKANEKVLTSDLLRKLESGCTIRALQQQRARYRDEEYKCEQLEHCLRKRIKSQR